MLIIITELSSVRNHKKNHEEVRSALSYKTKTSPQSLAQHDLALVIERDTRRFI